MPTIQVGQQERCTPRITLAANTEQIVQFADDAATITILSMDGTAPIWVQVSGGQAAVDGTDCEVIPAAIVEVSVEPPTSGPTRVSLISTGTPTVIVARG